jgi:hypothetical protein
MKMRDVMLAMTVVLTTPIVAFAKKTEVRKVQEVNFSEMNLKGTIRNPDGAYLVQKKGLKFMPLHDVQKDMDAKLRETSLYID